MQSAFPLIALLLTVSPADDDGTPAARQYQALLEEYEQEGGARAFAGRFLELAEEHPQDPAAADALLWVVDKVPGKPETTRALAMLRRHHLRSERLGPASGQIADARSTAAEPLLRAVLDRSPHRDVQARACYHLAALLDREAVLVDQLTARPDLAPRVLQYYGKDYGEHLASLKADELAKQRERVYERLLKSFPDVETRDATMGQIAEKMLFRIRHLSIGKAAPEIKGEDISGNEFRLSDYRGKVVMLTFWGHW